MRRGFWSLQNSIISEEATAVKMAVNTVLMATLHQIKRKRKSSKS